MKRNAIIFYKNYRSFSIFFVAILLGLALFLGQKLSSTLIQIKKDNTNILICPNLQATDFTLEKFINSDGVAAHAKLIQGTSDWIFHPQDFKSFSLSNEELSYLKRLNSSLNSKGSNLVIIKIPQRGQLYSQYLNSIYKDINFSPSEADQAYLNVITQLNEIGIITPNLLEIFKENNDHLLFYKADGHWTNKAQELAANATLSSLEKTSTYSNIKKEPHNLIYRDSKEFSGQYLTWIQKECDFEIPSYSVAKAVATPVKADKPITLFSQDSVETVLVGTSQSLPYSRHWNFSAHLAKALSLSISNESVGGAEGLAILDFFINSPNWGNTQPKFLIWEHDDSSVFPVHHLRQIIPAMQQVCNTKSNHTEIVMENNIGTLSENLSLVVNLGDYLKIESDTKVNEVIQVLITYQDDFKEIINLGHRKIQSNGQYFIEVLTSHGSLESIQFKTYGPSTIKNLSWQYCLS